MIDEADRSIREWVAGSAGGAETWLDPPHPGEQRKGVGLYLLELAEAPPPRGSAPTPLQMKLRYLVTAWGESPEKEHKLLADVAFAALARVDVEVLFRPLEAALWSGFGIAPRPCFFLQVPIRLDRTARRAPMVKEIATRFVESRRLDGVLLGPGDLPIAGARVELPALRLFAETTPAGRFGFARVPSPGPYNLVVSARGKVEEVQAVATPEGAPITIRLKLEEA
jgi:hypothetical protein